MVQKFRNVQKIEWFFRLESPSIAGNGKSALRSRVLARSWVLAGATAGFLSIMAAGLQADELHFKNGQRVEGKIIAFDYWSITIETANGNFTVFKHFIQRVVFDKPEPKPEPSVQRSRRSRDLASRKVLRKRYQEIWKR